MSDGWSLLIFPEGQREPGEAMSPFMPGVGLLASRLSLPVVPVRIRGADKVLPPGEVIPHPGKTEVHFGQMLMAEGDDPETMTDRVEEAVNAL